MIVTGGCMIGFLSPIQFGSEKGIVTGGGRERQWRAGLCARRRKWTQWTEWTEWT